MGGRGSAGGAAKAAAKDGSGAKSNEDRVLSAIKRAGEDRAKAGHGIYKGDSAPIADARDLMKQAGMADADFDKALLNLEKSGRIYMYSSSASRLLTPHQRTGGISRGGANTNIAQLK